MAPGGECCGNSSPEGRNTLWLEVSRQFADLLIIINVLIEHKASMLDLMAWLVAHSCNATLDASAISENVKPRQDFITHLVIELRVWGLSILVQRVCEPFRDKVGTDEDQSDNTSLQSLGGTSLLIETLQSITTGQTAQAMHYDNNIVLVYKLGDGFPDCGNVLTVVRDGGVLPVNVG